MSIRHRLLVLVLVAVLLPAVVLGLYFYKTRTDEVRSAGQDLATMTQLLGRGLEGSIRATSQVLYASSKTYGATGSSQEKCVALFSDLVSRFPEFTGFLVAGPDGVVECGSSATVGGLNVSNRDYFRAALSSHDVVVSPIRAGEITGRFVLPLSYALRGPDGAVKRVLIATLDIIQRADQLLDSIPYRKRILLLVDEEGVIVTRRPTSNGEIGTTIANTPLFSMLQSSRSGQVREQRDIDDVDRIWAAVPINPGDGRRLFLAIAVSRDEILSNTNANLINALAILGIAAFLAIAAALAFARISIERPIKRIISFTATLSAGDTAARISAPFPAGEFGDLMRALNVAADSLQTYFTELNETREQLFQSQKVESIGQLTGGVAHDFNNILTVIVGNIDLIDEIIPHDPELESSVRLVRQAAERGVTLTRSLLAYSRKQPLAPRSTDLNDLIKDTVALLNSALGEDVDMMTMLGDNVAPAMLDPAYLPTALINLCLNARDAMPNGGMLTIETANAYLDEEYASKHSEVDAGPYVMVAVSDAGVGIPQDNQDRIFDPFFTTKAVGKGTGLGLSMVYGFVKQSHGHIKVYSEIGRGTTFKLYFPRAISQAEKLLELNSDNVMPRGSETILIVEDDSMVRDSVFKQLSSLGYKTLSASTAVEALTILSTNSDVSLLFTDVVLPGGMNGRRLAEEACRGRPTLRVLFTSGYTENAIVHHGRLDRDIVLLTKPYTKGELARMVRTALTALSPLL